MIKKYYIWSLFILIGCISRHTKKTNDDDFFTDTECKKNIVSENNFDNKIYKTNTSYNYEFIFNLDTLNLNLKILPGSFYDQTKIKYEYLYKDSTKFEITGLIEGEKNIWIHPPRSINKSMEFSPFFQYFFKYDLNWKNKYIYLNYNPITKNKFGIVYHKYSVSGDTMINYKDKILKCKIVKVTTRFQKKNTISLMIYSDSLGLINSSINLINGDKYKLILLNNDTNYCRQK